MGSSIVAIANSALGKLGARTIISIDEATQEARTMKTSFEMSRKATLRSYPWSCATKRVVLSPVVGTPAFGYTYAFQLPSDYIRIREVVDEDDYRVEGQQILCNSNTLHLKYVWDLEDTMLMDELLCEAIACYLAWNNAIKITQSTTIQETMFQLFNNVIAQAKTVASQEQPSEEFEDDIWLASRENSHIKTRRDR